MPGDSKGAMNDLHGGDPVEITAVSLDTRQDQVNGVSTPPPNQVPAVDKGKAQIRPTNGQDAQLH